METNVERREKILSLRSEGKTLGEISKMLSCTKSLVGYYCGKRYDAEKTKKLEDSKIEYESIVCDAVMNSQNINQVCKKIGKKGTNTNRKYVEKIINKYNLDTTHFSSDSDYVPSNNFKRYKDSEVYCENSALKNTNSLRRRLLRELLSTLRESIQLLVKKKLLKNNQFPKNQYLKLNQKKK